MNYSKHLIRFVSLVVAILFFFQFIFLPVSTTAAVNKSISKSKAVQKTIKKSIKKPKVVKKPKIIAKKPVTKVITKTYVNSEAGYSLSYPAAWIVELDNSDKDYRTNFNFPNSSNPKATLTCCIANEELPPEFSEASSSFLELITTFLNQDKFEIYDKQQTEFLGSAAMLTKAHYTDDDGTKSDCTVLVSIIDNHMIMLFLMTDPGQQPTYNPHFNTFIKSFKRIPVATPVKPINEPSKTDQSSSSSEVVVDQITLTPYTNSAMGVKMLIPKGWVCLTPEQSIDTIMQFSTSNEDKVYLSVLKSQDLYDIMSKTKTLEEAFNVLVKIASASQKEFTVLEKRNITLAGVPAFEATETCVKDDQRYKTIERILIKNGTAYSLTFSSDPTVFDKYKSALVKCLDSFETSGESSSSI